MDSSLFRRKTVQQVLGEAESGGEGRLHRSLSALDLTMIGIGAIIGAGIFAITGSAAATKAGPAIVLSFVLSALGCACAGLCYAEMAAMIPVAGSAYTYAFATLGELVAWLIGWALVLEYAVGAITVAISWSGYFVEFMRGFGVEMPKALCNGYFATWVDAAGVTQHGLINLPAVVLVAAITVLLIVGVKESARATSIIVLLKVAVVLAFLALGVGYVKPSNWQPFMPFGWSGVIAGAGVIFFAYIGFDAVTTMSEEAKDPKRDLPRGILASLAICTVLYILVSGVLTGIVPYTQLNVPAPVALALRSAGVNWGAFLVSFGALAGLGSVVLVMMMGQPRVFMAMSRDGLLPSAISKVHPRFHTPYRSTMLTGIVVALASSTLNVEIAGELTSMGTLFAFVVVCVGVVVLRRSHPDAVRPFRTPAAEFVGPLGAITCLVMMVGLPRATQRNFMVWIAIGLVIYFTYSRKHSRIGKAPSSAQP
ncbi:MAG TPA: amino acid permease [Pseudomonadota bacterium]|nr:amino acid permease [Pseudomonadota bacterium]